MSRLTVLILSFSAGLALLAMPVQVHAQPVPNGLQLWLDADDASTITLDASNLVTEWRDKSPNLYHMTEVTDHDKSDITIPEYVTGAQNGRATIRFENRDALGRMLDPTGANIENLPDTEDRTIFAAIKPTAYNAANPHQNWVFSYGRPAEAEWNVMMFIDHGGGSVVDDDTSRTFFVGAGTVEQFGTPDLVDTPGDAIIWEFQYSDPDDVPNIADYAMFVDGAEDPFGDPTSFAPDTGMITDLTRGVVVGYGRQAADTNTSDIDFYELLLYDRALSTEERNQVGDYLAQKWAITSDYSCETGCPVPGDVDGDEVANIVDFHIIRGNFLNSVTLRTEGDLNADGIVDYRDFREWKDNRTDGSGSVVIPEPSSLLIALWGTLSLITLRQRGYQK